MKNATKNLVLILEDDELVRFIVKNYLTESGFEVQESADALSAIQIMEKKVCDVAIVDINIPKMSGEDFIVNAKKICPNIQFIIHTGASDYKVSSNLKEIGISQDDILVKPVEDMNIFNTTIKRLVQD